jgi:hypothetical protein
MSDDDLVSCADGCKRTTAADQAEREGWVYLEIQKRWRCLLCSQALQQVNRTTGESR